jgi:membrane protease YdiL (CAAX protease family)
MAATTPTKTQSAWQSIMLFVVLTFAISWGIWLGLRVVGVPFTLRTAIGMFGPALAATLVRLTRREGFADAGLRLTAKGLPRAGWMYLAAYVTIPILIFIGIGIALLTTYQHWALDANLHSEADTIMKALTRQGQSLPKGFSAYQLAVISAIFSTVLAFTFAIPINMIFTFGEEFGWRGYLLPRLAPLGGIPAALIVGVIWGLWHAPLIVLDGYNYPGHPALGVVMMVVFTTALSVIFAWLRFRSGSVWPSTLAHAAINAQAGFGLLLLSKGDSLIRPPIGILGLIPMIVLAIWLAATGRVVRPEETPAAEEALSAAA